MPNAIIDHAIEYALRGWYIFPCRPRDKKPLTMHGVNDSSVDIDTIKAWWTKWPSANIGLDCGRSGIIAVDVDAKSGGVQSWAVIKSSHQITDTLTSRTGGGGFHMLYSDPWHQYRNSTSKIAQGIDTRGQGGYIILPPSIHPSGAAYQWDDKNALVEAIPHELHDMLTAKPAQQPTPTAQAHSHTRYVEAAVTGELGKLAAATEGTRNNTLHVAAINLGTLIGTGELERGFVEDRLVSVAVSIGLTEREARLTVKSGLDYGVAHPRPKSNGSGNGNSHTNYQTIEELIDDTEPAVPMPDDPPLDDTLTDKPAQQEKQQWRIKTLADAYAERPPLQFLIEGLFTLPSLSIVYGNSGSLKSMLLADMAACVAAGIPWLTPTNGSDDLSRQVTQVPVLWCDFDNGSRRTDERFDAIGNAYQLRPDVPFYYVSMPSPWLDISKNESVMSFYDTCTSLGARFIIIDNLGVTIGGADENSSDMATVMGNARWLAEQMGAAIIFVHHQRKASGVSGHSGDDLRGHSSIKAALDLALLVEREDRAKSVTIKSTKTRDVDVAPFGAMFEYQHKPETTEMSWARFFCEPVDDSNSDNAIERTVCEVLEGSPNQNQAKLAALVKGILETPGKNRIWSVINRMVNEGKLTATTGDKNAKIYNLA